MRLPHIARLHMTHAHSVSTTTMHKGRAGRARDQRIRIWAASGHTNTRAFGQSMGARRDNATPAIVAPNRTPPRMPWAPLHRRYHLQNQARESGLMVSYNIQPQTTSRHCAMMRAECSRTMQAHNTSVHAMLHDDGEGMTRVIHAARGSPA